MRAKQLVTIIIMLALILTSACSSKNDSANSSDKGTDSGNTTKTDSEKPKDEPKKENVEISFVDVAPSPERKAFFDGVIAAFQEKNPNIKVKMESVPWDQAFNKLTTQGAAGTLPDVVNVYPAWLTTFVPAGYLEPISKQYDGWSEKDNLIANVRDFSMEVGQRDIFKEIYLIPDALMAPGLFVRTDWFQEANIPLPQTWDDVLADAEKLTDSSKNRYGWAYRGARAGFDQVFNYIASVTNGETYHDDGTSVLLDPAAIEAFKEFTSIYKKGWSPKDSINWGYQEMVQGFTSGLTAMLNQTTEVIATAKASMKDGTWTVIPFPKGRDGKRYAGAGFSWGYGISAKSKHKEESWQFIDFLSNAENNSKYSKQFTMIPIRKDVLSDPEIGQGPMKGFIDMLDDPDTLVGANLGSFPELGEFREGFMDAEVQKYLLDKQSAEDTMKHLGEFLTKAQQKYMKEHPEVPVPHVIKPNK